MLKFSLTLNFFFLYPYTKALEEGLKELKLKKAIELYVLNKISIKPAARIADISLAD